MCAVHFFLKLLYICLHFVYGGVLISLKLFNMYIGGMKHDFIGLYTYIEGHDYYSVAKLSFYPL